MNHPNEPTGNTRLADWLRRLLRYCIASELRPGVNYRVNRTANGTFLDIQPSAGTPAGGVAGAVTCYRLKSVQGDYLVCRTWDGSSEGGSDVNIAKPYKLRNPASESIGGATVTYSSYDNSAQTRVASITAGNETQRITPRYLVNDLIFVCEADYSGVTVGGLAVVKIDMNLDGRAWAVVNDAT